MSELLADPRVSADPTREGHPAWSPGIKARPGQAKLFTVMDDAEHAAQCGLLTADFTLKKVERLRPRVQKIVDDRLVTGG
jgi:cytochrome P450